LVNGGERMGCRAGSAMKKKQVSLSLRKIQEGIQNEPPEEASRFVSFDCIPRLATN